MKFSPGQIDDLKERNPVDGYCASLVKLRIRQDGNGFDGPCPFCSRDLQSKSDGRFHCDADKWMCAACTEGGDIIALVARHKGLDPKKEFLAILAELGGVAEVAETPATALRAGRRAFDAGVPCAAPVPYAGNELAEHWCKGWRKGETAAAFELRARERERSRLYHNFWERGRRWPGTPVERYLCDVRRLLVPAGARLRYLADAPLFADGREHEPLLVHQGPAMLAAIWNADPAASAADLAAGNGYRFAGLHFTFLDLDRPKGKAVVVHPDTGELLPAKKSRGSKQGGYIELGGQRAQIATRMVSGEGIENVLTAYTAGVRAGRAADRFNYRCGIDLGNLAGKALDRTRHPELKDKAGRARHVPGPTPDLTSAAMPVPAGVRQLIWMCDGDSEPLTTRNAMERARRRHDRPDLAQRLMWPGDGLDWNDRL